MDDTAQQLLGEWRQVSPALEGDQVSVRFEEDGVLVWIIEGEATLSLELAWSVDGDTLRVHGSTEPPLESLLRFDSPTLLVLERGGETYRYERLG